MTQFQNLMKWTGKKEGDKMKLFRKFKKIVIADFLTIAGMSIIVYTTYRLNEYVAYYMLGIMLIGLSYFIAKGVHK